MPVRRLRLALFPALLFILSGAVPAAAVVQGSNDPSFWSDGLRIYTDPNLSLSLAGLVVAPDGRLVYLANGRDFDTVRILTWRAVGDSTQGSACAVSLPGGTVHDGFDLAVDGAGRLLVLARSLPSDQLFVARYLYPSCALDPTFGSHAGWAEIGPESGNELLLQDLVVDAAGRIVIAARLDGVAILFRFLPDGDPDPGFSGDGRASAPYHGFLRNVVGLAVSSDGRPVVLMSAAAAGDSSTFVFEVFDGAGGHVETLEVPFEVAGTQELARPAALTFGADGRLVAAGRLRVGHNLGDVWGVVAALRITASGGLALDPTFGGDGRVEYRLTGSSGTHSDLADITVDDDGRVVLAGTWDMNQVGANNVAMLVMRLLPDGLRDPSFYPTALTSGIRLLQFDEGGVTTDYGSRIVLQGGRIVVGGELVVADGADLGLARLLARAVFSDGFESGNPATWSVVLNGP